jgi:WD40 repeat protein
MSFDKASSILATKDESTPTTVWLWDLAKWSPLAVIIQHAPVRQLTWRRQDPELLLIKCSQDESTAHLWNAQTLAPEAIAMPFNKTVGRLDFRWIAGNPARGAQVLVNDKQGFATLRLRGTAATASDEHDDDDIDASVDSVYEALVGRSPSRANEGLDLLHLEDDATEALDDTFDGRRHGLTAR